MQPLGPGDPFTVSQLPRVGSSFSQFVILFDTLGKGGIAMIGIQGHTPGNNNKDFWIIVMSIL